MPTTQVEFANMAAECGNPLQNIRHRAEMMVKQYEHVKTELL